MSAVDKANQDAHIQEGIVTQAKITEGTISGASISGYLGVTAGVVTGTISGGIITNVTIESGTIVNATTSEGEINAGTITGGKISSPVVTDDTITSLASAQLALERLKLTIEAWKKTVDVQQHFNDIQMRIRNFAVTVLTTVLAAAGLSIQSQIPVKFTVPLVVWNVSTLLAVWILGAGVIAIVAIFVTEFGYLRLLKGAVKHAGIIQEQVKNSESRLAASIALGETISANSKIDVRLFKINSTWRLIIFYGVMLLLLIILIVALHLNFKEALG